jgi:glycosyltransferase involved in cell wall biosynthesis
MLFDATILTWGYMGGSNRSGIYFVTYNILKQFVKEPGFNIAMCVHSMYEYNIYTKYLLKDSFFGSFPVYHTYEKANTYKSNIKKHKNSIDSSKNILRKFVFLLKIIKNYVYLFMYNKNDKKNNNLFNAFDVYFSCLCPAPFEITKLEKIKHFLFLHDTIPVIFPQYYPDLSPDHWYSKVLKSLCKENYYFCNSEHTKNDFLKYFDKQLDKNKLFVTYIASSHDLHPEYDKKKLAMILKKYNVNYENNKYIFSFCTLEPRKNLIFTIRCFVKFIEKHQIDDLYFFIGGEAWKRFIEHLKENINNLSAHSSRIVQLGYVDDEDVNILFSNSLFFTYISQYEGFGMPPLEAMQAGTPVITSNNSSLPEVVGDAAITITWDDEEACIRAFEDLYFNENLRKDYITKGIERAKLFSWEKTGKLMIDKILEIA